MGHSASMVGASTKRAATDDMEDGSDSEHEDEASNEEHSDAADHSGPMPAGPCVLFNKASFFLIAYCSFLF